MPLLPLLGSWILLCAAGPRADAFVAAPSVLVWDNDQGVTLCDPDFLTSSTCLPVGSEAGLVLALMANGTTPTISPALPADLSPYDAIYIALGWKEGTVPAGTISPVEQSQLVAYIMGGRPVFVQGNDFARDHQGTALLDLCGAVFNGDGNPAGEGNVSQLIGRPNTFAAGMVFSYPFGSPADNSVDDMLPGGSQPGTVLFDDQNGPGKAMSSPSESGSPRSGAGKGGTPRTQTLARGHTVVFTSTYTAMPDGPPPSTKTILMQRVLADFDLLVTPARPGTWGSIKALYGR